MRPKRNNVYGYDDAWTTLSLRDSPCLLVLLQPDAAVCAWADKVEAEFVSKHSALSRSRCSDDHHHCINFACDDSSDWAATHGSSLRCRYERETHEWVPMFYLADLIEPHPALCYVLEIHIYLRRYSVNLLLVPAAERDSRAAQSSDECELHFRDFDRADILFSGATNA